MGKDSLQIGKRIVKSLLFDLLLLAVSMLTFAYFHHVRVKETVPTQLAAPEAVGTPLPTFAPIETPAPTEEPAEGETEGGAGDAVFSAGGAVAYENSYKSENVSVTVTKEKTADSVYFVADIYVRDIQSLRCAVALDYKEYNTASRKNCMQVTEMAKYTGAIVAISGDNYVFREAGRLVIRDGMEWDKQFPIEDDICVLYYDGTMETYGKWSVNKDTIETIYERKPYQAWSFGPMLLDANGQPMTSFNSSVGKVNPRSAIGYYAPGHYCFILADGRQQGYSVGLTLTELSQIFYDLGCKAAYNLDGGDTVAMAFGTDLVNHPEVDVPRSVSDMVYICEPPAPGESAAQETPAAPEQEGEG